jgi:hypothetical protein
MSQIVSQKWQNYLLLRANWAYAKINYLKSNYLCNIISQIVISQIEFTKVNTIFLKQT